MTLKENKKKGETNQVYENRIKQIASCTGVLGYRKMPFKNLNEI